MSQMVKGLCRLFRILWMTHIGGHRNSSPICHGNGGSVSSVVIVAVSVGVGVAVVVAVSPLCFGLQGFRLK